jgi:hypothetical protein
MEPFLQDVDRFLQTQKIGRLRADSIRLAARSCLKGLQIADDDPDCRIDRVHMGKRDAIALHFIPKSQVKHLMERWEKQWDILRFHHLHTVADKVELLEQEPHSLRLVFYL